MQMINFKGYSLNKEKVQAISPVKEISTGTMACDWDFGFTVFLEGNSIDILCPTPTSFGNHTLTKEQRKEEANIVRGELLSILNNPL